nr:leucine-rich repeat protein [uncultured Oscillibacter sp.]
MKRIRTRLLSLTLSLSLLVTLLPVSAQAAGHSHRICGLTSCSHGHSAVTWYAWDGTSSIGNNYYYLTQDVTRTGDYTITGNVRICLNGHTLGTAGDAPGFIIEPGGSLTITDCQGTGCVRSAQTGIEMEGGSFTLWNGTIEGDYAGVDAYDGTVNIQGGTVRSAGSGICLQTDSKLTISGGSVTGTGNNSGIYAYDSSCPITISGGSVSSLYSPGTVEISGGAFQGNVSGSQLYLSGAPVLSSVSSANAVSLKNKAGTESYTGGGFLLNSRVGNGKAALTNVTDPGLADQITVSDGTNTGLPVGRLVASGTDLLLQTPKKSGSTGPLQWALYENGDFFLLGSGAMPDYTYSSSAPWQSYASQIKRLYVSEGVTRIGNYAFRNSALESVSFGTASLSLGNYSFAQNSDLTSIDFGTGTISPGELVFLDCEALTSVRLPENLVMNGSLSGAGSGYGLFQSCGSLRTAIVDCAYVGPFVFESCYSMTDATFTNPDVDFYFLNNDGGHPFHANSGTMNVTVHGFTCSKANTLVQASAGRYQVNLTFAQADGDTTQHTAVTLPGVAATCTGTGLTEGSKCSRCDYVIRKQTVLPATGHDYSAPQFTWAADLSGAAAAYRCAHEEEGQTRQLPAEFTAENGKLTCNVSITLDGTTYSDQKVLELAVKEGQLVLKLPGTLEGVTVLAVSYAAGRQMTGLQWLRQPEPETVLSVSGAEVRVFFLNGSYAPALPVLNWSAA